jgi:hypothetical protein
MFVSQLLARRCFGSLLAPGAAALCVMFVTAPNIAAQEQQLAKIEQSPLIYCRYRDPQTFQDKTVKLSGLASCHDGDAEQLVAYTPCEGKEVRELRRKDLKPSEIGCAGEATTPHEWVWVVTGTIVDIAGDQLTISHSSPVGEKTFIIKKYNLKGLNPQVFGKVQFQSVDLSKNTDPASLAKSFELFKAEAATGKVLQSPQAVVGVIVKGEI